MCRYGFHPYKTHYVCLDCRHVAKYDSGVGPRCPSCRSGMVDFGPDFHAPRKQNTGQWRKLRILADHGNLFFSCGCDGPGPRPRTLADAKRQYLVRKDAGVKR